jgi:hypothetical protein
LTSWFRRGSVLVVRPHIVHHKTKTNIMKNTKQIYDTFISQHEAQARAIEFMDRMDRVGAIICKHDLNAILGVSLLHKHFDIAPSEEVVGRLKQGFWCAEPAIMPPECLKPMAWKLDGRAWHPMEHFIVTPDLATKVAASDSVSMNPTLLAELADIFTSLGLEEIFGIALLDKTTIPIPRGMTWFEVSSERSRRMVLCQIQTPQIANLNAGTTVWDFQAPNDGTLPDRFIVKACAHGGSRCCCGEDWAAKAVLEKIGSPAAALFSDED